MPGGFSTESNSLLWKDPEAWPPARDMSVLTSWTLSSTSSYSQLRDSDGSLHFTTTLANFINDALLRC